MASDSYVDNVWLARARAQLQPQLSLAAGGGATAHNAPKRLTAPHTRVLHARSQKIIMFQMVFKYTFIYFIQVRNY